MVIIAIIEAIHRLHRELMITHQYEITSRKERKKERERDARTGTSLVIRAKKMYCLE